MKLNNNINKYMNTAEVQTITKEMEEALRKPLPKEAVKQHPTKTFLSSIKAIYVTERMNEVFGTGVWRYRVDPISVSDKGMVVVKVIYEIPLYGVYYEVFGGNDNGGENSKNFDLGDAYKGATTDALTKVGSYLGIGIDVFKGTQSAGKAPSDSAKQPSTPTKAPEVTKPYLNAGDSNYKNVVDALKNGLATVVDVEKKYRLSATMKKELLDLVVKK